jgi:hypothetical protein
MVALIFYEGLHSPVLRSKNVSKRKLGFIKLINPQPFEGLNLLTRPNVIGKRDKIWNQKNSKLQISYTA